MEPVLLLDVVGLTPRQIGADTPHLAALARAGAAAPMGAVLPAVTCSAQATMLTGLPPAAHGAVGNGWYDRDLGEVALWRQSNRLVRGEKIYERARTLDPGFTCAKLFWWWNLGAAVEWSITPRPFYPADGRKIPAIYTTPAGLGPELEGELGAFPFLSFWGPRAGLAASRWIADATLRVLARRRPALTLAYLPHLDYDHQRGGPRAPAARRALAEVDGLAGELVARAAELGIETVIVSEYGLEDVDRPIHVNRALRAAGLLAVRETPAGEVLDPFASRAFAVADHQVAHLYAADREAVRAAGEVVRALSGVAAVLGEDEKRRHELAHPRAGDLVLVAAKGAWFTYYYWLDVRRAPDFARTVDIHRKPGYDPAELFLDPAIRHPRLRVARRLLQKKLGMRMLLDVIPLDAGLVRGSHGRLPDDPADGPVFLCTRPFGECGAEPRGGSVAPTSIPDRVLALLQRRRQRG
ncbi:MAG: nucleotide pyrophosphatase/phosphodiesterase family protein [Planctomycetota bacterium]